MTKFSDSILAQIKQEKVHPLPRWRFLLKYGIIWTFLILSVIAAGAFLGVILWETMSADWSLASRWPGHEFGFLRETIGWMWGLGVLGMIGSAFFLFRATRRGYLSRGILLIVFFCFGALLLAFPLLQTSFPERLQGWHHRLLPPRLHAARFHNPEEGRLLGEITAVEKDTAYLEGVDGSTWVLWLFDGQILAKNELVEVFGEQIDAVTFAVLSIRSVPSEYSVQELPRDIRIDQ